MVKLGWIEKWTLRYAVVGLLFLALAGLEGFLMRVQLFDQSVLRPMETSLDPLRPGAGETSTADVFYSMLTAHPIVGIYGFAYMLVMGAFYELVPMLLKKEIRHKRLVGWNFWLQIGGVMVAWVAGFSLLFNGLYTLYWPLPVSYDRVPLLGSIAFGAGLVLIELNVLLFVYGLYSTVLAGSRIGQGGFWRGLLTLIGLPRRQVAQATNGDASKIDELPVFVVAVGRGSVDTAINAVVMLSAGVLLLVYGLPTLVGGLRLDPMAVNPLLYKNWFWWGLDMIADGNVLMYTAGVLYLLVPMLVGRKLYGESVVRYVILADLLVSLGVWSHHLMADTTQPLALRMISGQFVTWGEFVTLGLTGFAVLMTIWQARPVTFGPPLKFLMGSIWGFMVGGMAGLWQANLGLSVVLHNTQWVIGTHAHTMLLVGLSMLLFGVVYALIPLMTKAELRSQRLVDVHFWGWIVGAMSMTYAMGWAGAQGMLRRTLYSGDTFDGPMLVAIVGAVLMGVAFVVFLVNVLWTLGWHNVVDVLVPERWRRQPRRRMVPRAV